MNQESDECIIRLALQGIETPAFDIQSSVRERRRTHLRRIPWHNTRRIVLAAVAAALLTVTATAVLQLSGAWQAMFGDRVLLPAHLPISLHQSLSQNGYTLTLEDAIISDTDAALILTLRRADGQRMEDVPQFGQNELLIEGTDAMNGSSMTIRPEEDGSVAYLYQEYELTENPRGRELTLSMGTAAIEGEQHSTLQAGALDGMYRAQPVEQAAEPDIMSDEMDLFAGQRDSAPALPNGAEKGCRLAGVGFFGGALQVVFELDDSRRSDSSYCESVEVTHLTDTRSGQVYRADSTSGSGAGEHMTVYSTAFEGLSARDLPYLEAEITYRMQTPITQQPWTFRFQARGVNSWVIRDGIAAQLAGAQVQVDELSVSPLSIRISGSGAIDSDWINQLEDDDVYLTPRDGTSIKTHCGMSALSGDAQGGSMRFDLSFDYQDPEGGKRFLDIVREVASVTVGGVTIKQ